jgi:hypothetical protein
MGIDEEEANASPDGDGGSASLVLKTGDLTSLANDLANFAKMIKEKPTIKHLEQILAKKKAENPSFELDDKDLKTVLKYAENIWEGGEADAAARAAAANEKYQNKLKEWEFKYSNLANMKVMAGKLNTELVNANSLYASGDFEGVLNRLNMKSNEADKFGIRLSFFSFRTGEKVSAEKAYNALTASKEELKSLVKSIEKAEKERPKK